MVSEQRDFKDFTKIQGEITQRNWFEFPTLFKTDVLGHIRKWNIFVRLIKVPKKLITEDEWNLLQEDEIPLKKEYLTNEKEIPKGTIGQYWMETGVVTGKISRKAPTYVEPVLVDKANARNAFQEALIKARGVYLHQISIGYSQDEERKQQREQKRYLPMLALDWTKRDKIRFPCVVQPKLDGLRCVTFLDGADVVMYSRNQKDIVGFDDIKNELKQALEKMSKDEPLYLDGELYIHGTHLHNISGIVRTTQLEDKGMMKYNLFDCFYPSREDPYIQRLKILKAFFGELRNTTSKKNSRISRVATFIAHTPEEERKIYNDMIKKGYEGTMLKNVKGIYRTSLVDKNSYLRSPDVVKHKERKSREYEVVGYTSGKKGTNKDAIVWILKASDGEEFHATPNVPLKTRKSLFQEATEDFEKKFLGRMMTVEYDDISPKTGKPLRAKAISFRDE